MKQLSKIKATLFSVILAGSLAFTPGSLAFATSDTPDDNHRYTNDAEWTVTFNGSEMISENDDAWHFMNLMQPGDETVFEITLKNACDEEVDWYVKNFIDDSMEDDSSISGGAYSYELRYYEDGDDVGEIIYSNTNIINEIDDENVDVRTPVEPQAIGGVEPNTQSVEAAPTNKIDKTKTDAEGGGLLNAATSGEDGYVYLGRFAPNSTHMMTLSLGIDGETHTNAYFNTNAGVVIGYAAEPVGEGEEFITTIDQVQRVPRQVGGDLPQTGDMLPTISIICLVLGLIMLACGLASWMNDRRKPAGGQQ